METTQQTRPPDQPKRFDPEALIERIGPDYELIRELALLFAQDAPKLLDDIRGAVAKVDPATLTHSAHSLKGAAATLGGDYVSRLCLDIEMIGRSGSAGVPAVQLQSLEMELYRLNHQLLAYAEGLPDRT